MVPGKWKSGKGRPIQEYNIVFRKENGIVRKKRIRRLFSGPPNASLTRRKSEFENLE
jgi:hypothetical protein